MRVQRKISEGTLLIKEEPFVFVLSSKVQSEYCDNCFKRGKFQKCSFCKYVYYCGQGCQREAWSVHKPECKSIKRCAPRVIPDAARLLARLIRKLRKGGDLVKSYYTEGNFRMFKDLMSHYTDLKDRRDKIDHFTSLCAVLHEFLGEEPLPNSAELMGMYGRMCVNSFNICNAELITLGTGIYLGASVIDHSCKPNAVATFEGTTLYVRAIEPMPYIDWTQIHISYIDVMNTTKARCDELQYNYYFQCQCPRCTIAPRIDFVTGAACPNKKCDACIDVSDLKNFIDMKCFKCNTIIEQEFIDRYEAATKFTTDHLKNMENVAYVDICKFCLERQSGVLYKFNVLRVKTLDLAFQSSLDCELWSDAKLFGIELIEGYKKYYGDINPLLGLLYLKLGKLLLYQGDFRNALNYLKNACHIIKITHGATSRFFRQDVLELFQQAQIECHQFS